MSGEAILDKARACVHAMVRNPVELGCESEDIVQDSVLRFLVRVKRNQAFDLRGMRLCVLDTLRRITGSDCAQRKPKYLSLELLLEQAGWET